MVLPGPRPVEDRVGEYWDWFAVALFLLVSLDILTTFGAARAAGPGAEANPLMRWLLGSSLGLVVAVHLAAVVLIASFFYGIVRMLRRSPPGVRPYFALVVEVWIGALLTAGLVVLTNNLLVIVLGESLV